MGLLFEVLVFFFQAEDGIRDLVRSRGLGDVYKRQAPGHRHRGLSPARRLLQVADLHLRIEPRHHVEYLSLIHI